MAAAVCRSWSSCPASFARSAALCVIRTTSAKTAIANSTRSHLAQLCLECGQLLRVLLQARALLVALGVGALQPFAHLGLAQLEGGLQLGGFAGEFPAQRLEFCAWNSVITRA